MEYWRDGRMEYWSIGVLKISQHSSTPILHSGLQGKISEFSVDLFHDGLYYENT
jgi:hypothetical protein